MPAARRILLASLFHETHSFVSPNTTLADFAIRRGSDLMRRRGDGSTVDGFLEVAEDEGWKSTSPLGRTGRVLAIGGWPERVVRDRPDRREA